MSFYPCQNSLFDSFEYNISTTTLPRQLTLKDKLKTFKSALKQYSHARMYIKTVLVAVIVSPLHTGSEEIYEYLK